jgi:hypothetical protein
MTLGHRKVIDDTRPIAWAAMFKSWAIGWPHGRYWAQ